MHDSVRPSHRDRVAAFPDISPAVDSLSGLIGGVSPTSPTTDGCLHATVREQIPVGADVFLRDANVDLLWRPLGQLDWQAQPMTCEPESERFHGVLE